MDWFQVKTFFESLRRESVMVVDIYDATICMAVRVLLEM